MNFQIDKEENRQIICEIPESQFINVLIEVMDYASK